MPDSAELDFSPEFIRGVFEDAKEKERIAALARKRANRWAEVLRVEGLDHLIPEDAVGAEPQPEPAAANMPDRGTWPGEVLAFVRAATNGATRDDIRADLKRGPLSDKLRHNPNGFHSGLERLERRSQIVRYRDRFFTPSALELFMQRVEAGEVEDIPKQPTHISALDRAFASVVDAPGLTAGEQAKRLMELGEFPSVASVHNALSKLFMVERVLRINGKYFPANSKGSDSDEETAA